MKEIELSFGMVSVVDDSDYEDLNKHSWSYCKTTGYACRNIKGVRLYMHRYILDTPKGLYTDHIDRNKLNNCRDNLRICTPTENSYNRSKRKKQSSQYLGVSLYNKDIGKVWECFITENNKKKTLGSFYTETASALCYNNYIKNNEALFRDLNVLPFSDCDILRLENFAKDTYQLKILKGYYFYQRIGKYLINIRHEHLKFSKYYILEEDAISKVAEIKSIIQQKINERYDIE